MHTGLVDQKWIRSLCRSTGYPIGAPYKLYEENQDTIKQLLAGTITPQSQPLDFLITNLHKYHIPESFVRVEIGSKIQLADLN